MRIRRRNAYNILCSACHTNHHVSAPLDGPSSTSTQVLLSGRGGLCVRVVQLCCKPRRGKAGTLIPIKNHCRTHRRSSIHVWRLSQCNSILSPFFLPITEKILPWISHFFSIHSFYHMDALEATEIWGD